MKKTLIIGSTVADIIININKLPTTSEDIHVNSQKISLGGCAFNVCHVLHHLEIPYYFISTVGKGIYGEYVENKLKSLNIDHHAYSDEDNGCCYCMIENDGERTFISHHGAEYRFNPTYLKNIDINSFEYLYICGLEVEDKDGDILVQSLKDYKGTIIFAVGPRVKHIKKSLINLILDKHCILHMNEKEVLELSNKNTILDGIKYLYSITNNIIVVTCGAFGSCYYDGDLHHIKSYPTNIINTNGAGDSHCGAMISALCYGCDISKAISFANNLASKVVNTDKSNLDTPEYIYYKSILPTLKSSLQV